MGGREAVAQTILPPAVVFCGAAVNIFDIFIRDYIWGNLLALFGETQYVKRKWQS